MTGTDDFALSVVMPVHAGADPEHFRRALESIYDQTFPASEVIVVEDGPLTDHHYAVLDDYAVSDEGDGTAGPGGRVLELRRIALPENRGAAAGNQAGLEAARCPWVAKADSDDINLPARFAVQVDALRAGDLDCVGSSMFEFDGPEDNVLGIRTLPSSPEKIARYARRNNPANHPTLIYRRDLALSVGGYRPLPYMEDYDLVARMLAAGARIRNLPEPLVLFRAGDAMLGRRKTRGIFASERTMQRNLRTYGIVGPIEERVNLVARTGFRLLPAPLLRRVYGRLFHSRRRRPGQSLSAQGGSTSGGPCHGSASERSANGSHP